MPLICCQSKQKQKQQLCLLLLILCCRQQMCHGNLPAPTAVNMENDILHFTYELEHWLDVDKRPCQDFVGYVCGRSSNASQAILEERLEQEQERFDKFLAADNDEQLLDAELKVKHFYDACRNARSLEELKSSFMYRQSGGWPAIDDSQTMLRKRRNTTWLGVLTAFHEVGAEYFFQVRIEVKSNKRIVHMQPDPSMRYTLRKFEQLAEEIMQEYAVDGGRARLVALEILNFERNRREISKAKQQHDDKVLEWTFEQFKSSSFATHVHPEWDNYFRKILGKNLKPNDTMLLTNLDQLMELFELIQKTTITRLLNWIWIDYLMDKSAADCQALVQTYFEPIYQHIAARVAIDKVQMAQMYADLGRAYEELLRPTSWIDEMSQQNSKQFLGRVMHLTLNGDAKLDEDYQALTVTKRNFYRNMEKVQRFHKLQKPPTASQYHTKTLDLSAAANEFMQVFLAINSWLHKQNLSTPLNYALVGERFAEHMIAGGSSSNTPGAWRSMDSERDFSAFEQCMLRQSAVSGPLTFNLNNLILKLLAQQQTLHALAQWQQKDATLVRRLDNLLAAGRLQLSFKRLYFVGTLLSDCQLVRIAEQQELVNSYLKNSWEFTQAFGCRPVEPLYARNVCKVV